MSGSPFNTRITLYVQDQVLRDLRKFLEGSVFINTFNSLIMRDSQLKDIEAYPSG